MKLENELLKEQEGFATFVHGALCGLHSLSVLYNLKKRNYTDAIIHGVVAIYDLGATLHHRNKKKDITDYGDFK